MACIWRPDSCAALTLVPAWCWFLAGLASTIPAWRARSRRTAGGLVLCWLVFAIGWVEDASSLVRAIGVRAPSQPNPAERPLRIVSLNCASDERALLDLQHVNPDLVLLQEAPGRDGLAKMTTRLFGDAGSFLAGGDTAILARGQIEPHFVDPRAPFVAGRVVFADGRKLTCVSLRLAPPPSRLDFWSTGFWRDHREMRNKHRRQLREIMVHLHEISASSGLLVGGDFNTVPLDRALDELRPPLTDAFDHSGIGWGATGTNAWPLFRVDQVWTNSRLVPIRIVTQKTRYSDHRMVVCDAVLQE
jgi:endonuclease/exonuclease/phosphatase (EEP) superfamily protein YafD